MFFHRNVFSSLIMLHKKNQTCRHPRSSQGKENEQEASSLAGLKNFLGGRGSVVPLLPLDRPFMTKSFGQAYSAQCILSGQSRHSMYWWLSKEEYGKWVKSRLSVRRQQLLEAEDQDPPCSKIWEAWCIPCILLLPCRRAFFPPSQDKASTQQTLNKLDLHG